MDEFKLGAVKQLTKSGHSVAEVAVRLGISQPTLDQWIKNFRMPEPERIELQGYAKGSTKPVARHGLISLNT